jgi:hypothetical protein
MEAFYSFGRPVWVRAGWPCGGLLGVGKGIKEPCGFVSSPLVVRRGNIQPHQAAKANSLPSIL